MLITHLQSVSQIILSSLTIRKHADRNVMLMLTAYPHWGAGELVRGISEPGLVFMEVYVTEE
jgi:hypothetical protein